MFTDRIRELFRLPEDVDISLTFGCKVSGRLGARAGRRAGGSHRHVGRGHAACRTLHDAICVQPAN